MPADRYALEDRVVDGDRWSSWRATDSVLHRDVGVVVVAADHPRRDAVAAAARSASCVTDPGFLHVYDVIEQPPTGAQDTAGELRVIREWTPGGTLADRLAEGPMEVDDACVLGITVARSLGTAHAQGVTHGALGPGDVLLTDDGRAKVRGLGIRAVLDQAPQPRSDAWAAAALTYAAVTGCWPDGPRDGLPGAGRAGTSPRPRQVRAGLPKVLDQALARTLADPPEDPNEVARTLEQVLVAVGRRASDGPTAAAAARRRRDGLRRFLVGLAFVALAAAAWLGFQLVADQSGGAASPGRTASPTSTAAPTPSDSADPTGRVVVIDGKDFDPDGNGEEHSDQVPLAFDGNLATAWSTVSYNRPDLAPKTGVGVVFDLGQVETVGAVRLSLLGAGTTLEVRVASRLGTHPGDFSPFGAVTNAGELVALRSPDAVQARYVLVWLTGLPADGTSYRGGIAEIVVARS